MKVSALSSPPITDVRVQQSAEQWHPNIKPIYEPDPIPSITVKTALTHDAAISSRVSYIQMIGRHAIRMFVNQVISEYRSFYLSCIYVSGK